MKTKTPWYNKIEMAIIVVLFSCMTLITFGSVVSRYCFSFTFSWAEQLTRVMFAPDCATMRVAFKNAPALFGSRVMNVLFMRAS